MQISASDIMEKMIKKLRTSQCVLDAGTLDKKDMKATLISIKVYCDLLLEELDDKATVTESNSLGAGERQLVKQEASAKLKKPKVLRYEEDDDANGSSIFDF